MVVGAVLQALRNTVQGKLSCCELLALIPSDIRERTHCTNQAQVGWVSLFGSASMFIAHSNVDPSRQTTPTPSPSATPVATSTPTPMPCVGDCSDDGSVTVDEIITMVNIALGNVSVTTCEAGDANQDGQITVDEILTAVNHALNGCWEGPSNSIHPPRLPGTLASRSWLGNDKSATTSLARFRPVCRARGVTHETEESTAFD